MTVSIPVSVGVTIISVLPTVTVVMAARMTVPATFLLPLSLVHMYSISL
jgi:hypothetical protein